MTMRAERIAEIRERVEKAIPGPWWAEEPQHDPLCGWNHLVVTDNQAIARIDCDTWIDGWEHPAESCPWAEDTVAFIAHARQDVPWLLAEVERLEHLLRTFVPGPAAVMIGDPE